MKLLTLTLLTYVTTSSILWSQSFTVNQHQPDTRNFKVERDLSGDIIIYEGYTKIQSIEKNYYGGYDVYSYESGWRDKIRSVERGTGDVYNVYSYDGSSKEKISTIRGFDEYLKALYGPSDAGGNQSPVQVYDVKGDYISGLGKTVLPASVQPLDFSALDSYMDTKTRLMEADLQRVKQIATILESGTVSESEKKVLIDELKRIKKFWEEN